MLSENVTRFSIVNSFYRDTLKHLSNFDVTGRPGMGVHKYRF